MHKLWKIVGIGGILLIILAIGASITLAQDLQDPDPLQGPNFADEDGDDSCDHCGQAPPGNFSDGWHGRGGMGMMDGQGAWGARASSMVSILAQELGMTIDDVFAELSTGISIAEFATKHGVEVQIIVDAFLAERAVVFNQAVEDGRMTQERADWMLERMTEQIVEHVNEPWASGEHNAGQGHGGSRGGGRAGSRGGGGAGQNQDAVPQAGAWRNSNL